MAHKNILMGLSGGQLFSLDHRMIHPRRPTGLPTVGEKEEREWNTNQMQKNGKKLFYFTSASDCVM